MTTASTAGMVCLADRRRGSRTASQADGASCYFALSGQGRKTREVRPLYQFAATAAACLNIRVLPMGMATEISPPTDHRNPLSQIDEMGFLPWMQASNDKIPLHSFMGLRVVEVGDGKAKVAVELAPQLEGQAEPLHGAVVVTIAAVAAGCATWGAYDPSTTLIISQESHIRHLGQPRSSPIAADAQLVHRGKRALYTEAVVTDGGGYELARISHTWGVVTNYGGHKQ